MFFMLIALISVGSGLVGIIGVLVHFLLKQGGELRDLIDKRHDEAMAAIAAIGKQGLELHTEAMAAIAKQGVELRDHADKLHREAMTAIAKQGERLVDLHLQAIAAVAALGERTAALEAKAGGR